MKKLTVVTTLIGVLALAACSDTGVEETEVDENEVEEDALDDSDDDEEENEIEDAGTEEDEQRMKRCCRFRRHYFYDSAYFIEKIINTAFIEKRQAVFFYTG